MSPARTQKAKSASPAKRAAAAKPKSRTAKAVRPPTRTPARGRAAARSSRRAAQPMRGPRGQAKGRIFDLLREEHRQAMALLEQICEGRMDEEERRAEFAKFRSMIMGHSLAEARAFYAPLKQAADDPEKVLEADVEHLVVERLLEDLSGDLLEDELWMARAKVLKELIRHHVQEEENTIFQLAQKSCDQAELDKMADDFESERGRLVEAVA